jgi:hypothetical protein
MRLILLFPDGETERTTSTLFPQLLQQFPLPLFSALAATSVFDFFSAMVLPPFLFLFLYHIKISVQPAIFSLSRILSTICTHWTGGKARSMKFHKTLYSNLHKYFCQENSGKLRVIGSEQNVIKMSSKNYGGDRSRDTDFVAKLQKARKIIAVIKDIEDA